MSLLKKRNNLSKEQISQQIANQKKIERLKDIVRKAFPSIVSMDSIYDAQTAVNALGGFIGSELEKEVGKIKVSDLSLDLSREEDGKIKTAVVEMIDLLKDESAEEISETMERLGTTLQAYVTTNAMKEKMNITVDDIVSK